MKARVTQATGWRGALVLATTAAIVTAGVAFTRAAGEQTKGAAAPAQKLDEAYTKKIVDNTPDKRILTDLIDHMPLPADPKVPSPLKVLGYIPGENGNLTYSADVYKYLDAL